MPGTTYVLGTGLAIAGQLLAAVAVDEEAPNDIAGTPREKGRIAASRVAFGLAVRAAFDPHPSLLDRGPAALVIHHRPQRDEDNTWATWIAAACGTRSQAPDHWAAGAPLSDWAPQSIASLADSTLDHAVVYALWSGHQSAQRLS